MTRLTYVSTVVLAITAASIGDQPAAAPRTHTVTLNGHTFTLPVGFTVELVAADPVVKQPITADFDEQGRLYVTEANGAVTKEDVAQKKPMHHIVRLEDSDGNGTFDKSVVFADQMLFPEGTMWYAGSLYVAAPPSIWKLTDTDGDGVADVRSEWFQGKTLTGCANDLHGPYLGPDGWIYWAKGAFAKQTYERPGKKPFVTRAAHIFRCRPNGSGIEAVMTGGMDNPVDVVFTPGGERIFTTTFFQFPGGGQRDGLIHAVYGGIYGKDWDPIYEHPWTGPAVMPVLAHFGAAAPCGSIRYESSAFGREYQDNLFACQFNMHKVSRHVLTPQGATFQSRDEDFLLSGNLDFHPTDIVEDADGSILVVDTGGWYKLCCPTSQLHKPDILGAIYRVRRSGAPRIEDPRGSKLPWATLSARELAGLLDDLRPAVRRRAVQTLGERGGQSIPVLADVLKASSSPEARRNAVWAATRVSGDTARAVVRSALKDKDETVRQTALHSISVLRDIGAVPELLALLQSGSPHNRRAAAEALGRCGDTQAVSALLAAASEPADRALGHSLTYALIEIADRAATAAGLASSDLRTRRAALVALDQMEGGQLDVQTVAKELGSADAGMKETAWWIASRHPEWGGALAGALRERLEVKSLTDVQRQEVVQQLARFAKSPAAQQMLAERLQDPSASADARRTVLRAMAQAALRDTPALWFTALTHILQGDDADLVREGLVTARALRLRQKPDGLAAALMKLAQNDKEAPPVRLHALAAIPGTFAKLDASLFEFLRAQLGPDQPVAARAAVADVLSRAKLDSVQLVALADSFKAVGPMELDRLLDPFAHSADEKVGVNLVAALTTAPARSSLRSEALKQRLAKYPPPVHEQAKDLYSALDAAAGQQRARLEELMGILHVGDVRRGQAVFQSTKAACSACHTIGYLGGKLGPDLTRIGSIRNERDLLESIAFPSVSFVRSYEPVQITTKSGKVLNGLIQKDTPDDIVLATAADQLSRIPREEIDEIVPGKVSIMPAGLDQQLTPAELADLVAFLKACK